MEILEIKRDKCGARVPKAHRTKVRGRAPAREASAARPLRRLRHALVLEPLGLVTRGLPFGDSKPTPLFDGPACPAEGDNLTVHPHERKAR
jgi:hypothetical protein